MQEEKTHVIERWYLLKIFKWFGTAIRVHCGMKQNREILEEIDEIKYLDLVLCSLRKMKKRYKKELCIGGKSYDHYEMWWKEGQKVRILELILQERIIFLTFPRPSEIWTRNESQGCSYHKHINNVTYFMNTVLFLWFCFPLIHTDLNGFWLLKGSLPLSIHPNSIIIADCGGNITNEEYGIIRSPHWPNKYDGPDPDRQGGAFSCTWFIHVRPYHKVLLWLQSFSVEGNPAGESWHTGWCNALLVHQRFWIAIHRYVRITQNHSLQEDICHDQFPSSVVCVLTGWFVQSIQSLLVQADFILY